MGPSAAWLAHLDAGGVPDPLHGDWEDLSLAVRRAMTVASKVERSVAHFHSSGEHGDGVDLHLDLKIGHRAAAT
jgi:hypothetical protein